MQHHVFQMGIRAFQEYFKGFVMLFFLCQIFFFCATHLVTGRRIFGVMTYVRPVETRLTEKLFESGPRTYPSFFLRDRLKRQNYALLFKGLNGRTDARSAGPLLAPPLSAMSFAERFTSGSSVASLQGGGMEVPVEEKLMVTPMRQWCKGPAAI